MEEFAQYVMSDRLLLLGTLRAEDVKALLDSVALAERLQLLAAMNEAMREEYIKLTGLRGVPRNIFCAQLLSLMHGKSQQQFFHSLDPNAKFAVMSEMTDPQLEELLGHLNPDETAQLMTKMGASLQEKVMSCLSDKDREKFEQRMLNTIG